MHTSLWMSSAPKSVRNSAPVGQTSRQPASTQCLQESLIISQRDWVLRSSLNCSMNFTCRQFVADR